METGQFFIAGINYKKTDAAVRGNYAINPEQYAMILQRAKTRGVKELFVLSTCNRTEIYGVAPDAETLIDLLCTVTLGSKSDFVQRCYIKQDEEALQHIFSVGAGLDSQILGDYEIVGQMKLAVKFSKEKGMIGSFIERLFNTVLQSSKQIKNETALSGGTISVSFAAIQFIRQQLTDTSDKKIVLLGTGKIGRNTCKNLVDYLDTKNITLINRTAEKAAELAENWGLQYADWNQLENEIHQADIVIVATNAEQPVITAKNLKNIEKKSGKQVLDISDITEQLPKAVLTHLMLILMSLAILLVVITELLTLRLLML